MKTKLTRLIALLLAVVITGCMFTACDSKQTVSEDGTDGDVIYGDDTDFDDDDDEVIDTSGSESGSAASGKNDKTSSATSGSGNSNKVTGGNASKPNNNYTIDETEKKSFLESIPSSLSGKTVRVLIWWKPGVAETAKAKEFEKKTGIKIKFITSETGYMQKLSSMIAQGNAPDLACIQQENFPSAIMQDYFEPLSKGKLDLTDKIYDIDTMNQFKYNGTYYGAMIKSSTMITFNVLLYNADVFKKAKVKTPNELWQEDNWNWDTFLSTCKEIMQKDKSLKAAVTGEYQCNYLVQTAGTDPVKFVNGKPVNNT